MSELIVKLHKPHVNQKTILSEKKRFNVLKCGRRFGKTDLIKELSSITLDGKYVGLWSPTYKDVHEVWKELLYTYHEVIQTKNEQVKQIVLITGGIIDLWSMDDPNSGRGRKYHRAIIDEAEKAGKLKEAWEETIRATLADYSGDAWIMSTPKFGQTYFKTTLFTNQERFDNWKSWRFTSYDNPHLPDGEIDEVKAQLADLVFRCEYMAEDVDIVDNPWAFAFDTQKHVAKGDILRSDLWKGDKNHKLDLSFDFNRNPICCMVSQYYNDTTYVIDVIKLKNSDIYSLCNHILVKYPNFLYRVTGDATGKGSTALVRDNLNYYTVILRQLKLVPTQIQVPSKNPSIEENQVLVNSILQNGNVLIHPEQGKPLIFDLLHVNVSPEGKIDKTNRSDETQQADALDCFRYNLNQYHRNFLNLVRK